MKALVTHPGLQHSHQLAWALQDEGHLLAFWSGVPVRDPESQSKRVLGMVPRETGVPASKRQHRFWFPALRRAASALLPSRQVNSVLHRLDYLYDVITARRILTLDPQPDVVIAYENSALHTFRVAKQIGAVRILDAASIHYASARKWLDDSERANPPWIDERKKLEIELADAIITCSDLAARTYTDAGVRAERVHVVPLGADLPPGSQTASLPIGAVRFVYAGTLRRLKGIDLLLDVFEALQREGVPAHLTLIGNAVEKDLVRRASRNPAVTLKPFMPHARLMEELSRHHVLVLPSRFDAFGMVVVEAMANGVPAIVSERVGARCAIDRHPGAGWIVGCDRESLGAQIRALVTEPSRIVRASTEALVAAKEFSWERYRQRASAVVADIYRLGRASG